MTEGARCRYQTAMFARSCADFGSESGFKEIRSTRPISSTLKDDGLRLTSFLSNYVLDFRSLVFLSDILALPIPNCFH
jgi:hypothetical protein